MSDVPRKRNQRANLAKKTIEPTMKQTQASPATTASVTLTSPLDPTPTSGHRRVMRDRAQNHVHHRRQLRRRELRDVRPRVLAALPVHVAQREDLRDGRGPPAHLTPTYHVTCV